MAANQDRRQRRIAPRQVADHIAGGQALRCSPGEGQRHAQRFALSDQPHQHVCIRVRHRRRWYRSDTGRKICHAGMRIAVAVRPDRADHDGRRALGRGHRRPLTPRLTVWPIAAAILRRLHRVIEEHDLACQRSRRHRLQRIERGEVDHVGLDPCIRRRSAEAERRHRQLLRHWHGQPRRIGPAHIGTRCCRFDRHIADSHGLELVRRPSPPARFGLAPGKALADFAGQSGDELPRRVVRWRGRHRRTGKERRQQRQLSKSRHHHISRQAAMRLQCPPPNRNATRFRSLRGKPAHPACPPPRAPVERAATPYFFEIKDPRWPPSTPMS